MSRPDTFARSGNGEPEYKGNPGFPIKNFGNDRNKETWILYES